MDANNWRAAQGQVQMPGQVIGGEPVPAGGMEGGDWRTQLQQDSRQRIVDKIMETLKRHLPFSGQEGLQEIRKIAVRFEDKIYTEATSQSDYLRKISLKMLTMETKSQNPMANTRQSNAASNSRNSQAPDYLRKISLKMLTMETKSQNPMANTRQSNAASNSRNPQAPELIVPPIVKISPVGGGDWRTQLQQHSRQRIVNKILETLKRHLPFSGQEGLQELKKIAVRFEDKIYTAATSQSDYLRKISLKMLTMEVKSQNPMVKSSSV